MKSFKQNVNLKIDTSDDRNYNQNSDQNNENQQSPLPSDQNQEKKLPIPANPLLPKMLFPEQKEPPQCPLKDIQFIQIQKFRWFQRQIKQWMGDGYDQIGKKNMMRENREKRRQHEQQKIDELQEAKMDEFTHIIQNIVYARDPKIFDNKNGFVNQREAFMHENLLDIKPLIKINEERSAGIIGERFGMVRQPPPKKYLKSKQQIEKEIELEAKARYKLKTLENGLVDKQDKTLLFESRFESGNLYLAQKVSDHEYNLLMQNDINTNGHTQWFFYQVKNTRKNSTVQFNIMNFTKPDSLFNFGMKVSIYSEKNSDQQQSKESEKQGWHKGGEHISYYLNGIRKDNNYMSKGFYTLSFSYKFLHDEDTVYFAYSYPYTYSDLISDIFEIENDIQKRSICSRKLLCKTLAGNDCDVITITEKGDFQTMQAKKAVIISARVHPGEVVGSWMMRGVLLFLTDMENEEAKILRQKYIFKIIPMLNPDGVINGNYRCSLAGCDLNRRWKTPHKSLHPTIYYTKKLIKDTHNERGILLYCDFHGHSRKQNVFMYGCNNKQKPEECRVFPLMLSKLSKFFQFSSCRFGVQKSKESTARVSLYKELKNCPNIFTMESTFSGIDFGEMKGMHLCTTQFQEMGRDLCRTLLIYENLFIPPEIKELYPENQSGGMFDIFSQELQQNKKLIEAGDGDSSDGSESEPSEDNLGVEEFAKVIPIVDKNQKMLLTKIQKKKEIDKDLQLKKQVVRKGDESPIRSPSPKQRQPIKPPVKIEVKPEEEKKEEKKKPEMKDAQTQTDRSDYQMIKKKAQERKLREMKEYQNNLRAQAQQQFKSPVLLMDTNMLLKKAPQSQTAQRNDGISTFQLGQHQFINQIQQNLEKNNAENKDNPNFQQKEKFGSVQLQNINFQGGGSPQHLPAQFQNQILQNRGIGIPGQPQGFSGQVTQILNNPGLQISNKKTINNIQNQYSIQNQQILLYQQIDRNNLIMQNNKNISAAPQSQPQAQAKTDPLQQLQIQTQIKDVRNQQNFKTSSNSSQPVRSFFEEKQGLVDIVDRRATQVQQQNNLKGPSSTMSKAGEQILLASANNNMGSIILHSSQTSSPVKQQQHAISSSHFGAIHMGGGMSFVKDQGVFVNKGQNSLASTAQINFNLMESQPNLSIVQNNIMITPQKKQTSTFPEIKNASIKEIDKNQTIKSSEKIDQSKNNQKEQNRNTQKQQKIQQQITNHNLKQQSVQFPFQQTKNYEQLLIDRKLNNNSQIDQTQSRNQQMDNIHLFQSKPVAASFNLNQSLNQIAQSNYNFQMGKTNESSQKEQIQSGSDSVNITMDQSLNQNDKKSFAQNIYRFENKQNQNGQISPLIKGLSGQQNFINQIDSSYGRNSTDHSKSQINCNQNVNINPLNSQIQNERVIIPSGSFSGFISNTQKQEVPLNSFNEKLSDQKRALNQKQSSPTTPKRKREILSEQQPTGSVQVSAFLSSSPNIIEFNQHRSFNENKQYTIEQQDKLKQKIFTQSKVVENNDQFELSKTFLPNSQVYVNKNPTSLNLYQKKSIFQDSKNVSYNTNVQQESLKESASEMLSSKISESLAPKNKQIILPFDNILQKQNNENHQTVVSHKRTSSFISDYNNQIIDQRKQKDYPSSNQQQKSNIFTIGNQPSDIKQISNYNQIQSYNAIVQNQQISSGQPSNQTSPIKIQQNNYKRNKRQSQGEFIVTNGNGAVQQLISESNQFQSFSNQKNRAYTHSRKVSQFVSGNESPIDNINLQRDKLIKGTIVHNLQQKMNQKPTVQASILSQQLLASGLVGGGSLHQQAVQNQLTDIQVSLQRPKNSHILSSSQNNNRNVYRMTIKQVDDGTRGPDSAQ